VKRYQISLYKTYRNASIYTIQEQGTSICETDHFFFRFQKDSERSFDLQVIKRWIEKIGENGALERYFKPEGKALAIPVPPPKSDLRLYCFRVSDQILILGNGGLKTSKKVKDSPDAYPHFQLMNSVAFIFDRKRDKGEIKIEAEQLKGNLSFFIKEQNNE